MNLDIAPMTIDDIAEVAAIERKIFSMPWSENGFLSSLQSSDTRYLVVREKGKLIAYCGYLQSLDEADITNVAVDPAFHNRGVGYQMLRELMRLGEKNGVHRYTLEVRESNVSAIHLYEKLGFAAVGIRKNFYEKPQESAVIMWTEE